jgi:hypothetical protein
VTPLLAAQFTTIELVMVWGVFSVLLWFLLSTLKRGHKNRILRVRITIEEIRQSVDDDPEIGAALDEILGHLQQAEDSGPLMGRKGLSAAHGAIAALVARVQEEQSHDDEEDPSDSA